MSHIVVPTEGQKIVPGQAIPNNPIIPFIEGDGIGVDITPVMIKVIDAAVAKAYQGEKKISWMEIFAGEKATRIYGDNVWLPDETLQAIQDYKVSNDHTCGWWHPLFECGHPSKIGFVPMCAACTVFQRRAIASERPKQGQYGHFP